MGAKERHAVLFGLAIIFAVATVLYSIAWMYDVRRQPVVELGFDTEPTPAGIEITNVYKGSPAESAGLRRDDMIVAINGKRVETKKSSDSILTATWLNAHPGEAVLLAVRRPGRAQPFQVRAVFRAIPQRAAAGSLTERIADQIIGSFPIIFLVVGLVVLFLRVESPHAWLLALVFAGLIGVSNVPNFYAGFAPVFRKFLLAYRTVFTGIVGPLFYFFFAVFPTRSPIDRAAPWLKWTLLILGAYLSLGGIASGDVTPLPPVARLLGARLGHDVCLSIAYGSAALGIVALIWNASSISKPDERRKINVILWGTIISTIPAISVKAAGDISGYHPPLWLDFVDVSLMFLFPLSLAYAVVKHRVLEIPLLLKRSARYFVVERGFVFLILAISVAATLVLAQTFSQHFSAGSKAAIPVGATFGVLLMSAGTQVHRRVRSRLDRAFFRSAYDAQQVLQNLAAKTVAVTSRQELAALLDEELRDALHPQLLFVYLETSARELEAMAGNPPPDAAALSHDEPEIIALADRGAPAEMNGASAAGRIAATLQAECLVPIPGAGTGSLQGLVVLGPRMSEEPYSAGDKRLLASVASQAGIAMRSISLAEKMAQHMEAERRAAQEMEIARQVQSKLLPQYVPALRTLECAGKCIQTRVVGGDYYDFLDLGSRRIGLVIADISGKGISGALLMANLQANLRSQYALAHEDIPHLLCSVNHLFFKNTEENKYATLFFGVYDDESRSLRYANCGHNPPLLIRGSSSVERLEATATVLGLFEHWDCSAGKIELAAGDALVIYTDGITEACNSNDEEFGEERLIQSVRRSRSRSAAGILEAIIADVQCFASGGQQDDMTVIVARAR